MHKPNLARFSGKIYPDKTFAVGVVPEKKKTLQDELYDKDIEEVYDSYTERYSKYGRTKKRTVQFLASSSDCGRFIKGQESSRNPKHYGSKGITRYGKKSISCFGAILSERYHQSSLGFGTCTIPGYSDIVLLIVGREWGEITRRFFQKLRRHCQKKDREFIYYGVSEIQEKRFKRIGIPVPHLHWGCVSRDNRQSEFYFTSHDVRRFWEQSVVESLSRVGVVLDGENVNYKASIDIQVVKKSISAYMSKYFSKGCKTVEKMVENGFTENLPKQWWFASMQMKKWLKESIIRMPQDMCASFFHGIESLLHKGVVTWCNFVDVETEPGRYVIFGIVGRIDNGCYWEYRREFMHRSVAKTIGKCPWE